MSASAVLSRWLGWAGRDAQADGSGVSPAAIRTAAADAVPGGEADPSEEPLPGEGGAGRRRERMLGGGAPVLLEVVAEKVLNGWLQNRQQVLFPLTLNLRKTEPAQAVLLVEMMAVAALAGDGSAEGAAESAAAGGRALGRAFLAGAGGDAGVLAAFDAALADPPALSRVVAEVLAAGLGAYGYVVALAVLDGRDVLGARFLEYLEARLGLPTAVVRSAVRRYGR